LQRLRNEHLETLTQLKLDHSQTLSELKSDHSLALTEVDNRHRLDIGCVRAEMKAVTQEVKDSISGEFLRTEGDLTTRLTEKVEELRALRVISDTYKQQTESLTLNLREEGATVKALKDELKNLTGASG
jgi:predicted transcriptional regulator